MQHIDSKILCIDSLAQKIKDYQMQGKKVVLCHGVFDLLHIGHIRYFRQAAQMGDVLVVTVTPDKYVDKGPARPAFPQHLRVEGVASQHIVDHAAISIWPTAEKLLLHLKPDIYVKGADFKSLEDDPTGKLQKEANVCQELGIAIKLTEDIVFSSTNLINRFMSTFSDDVQEYLTIFRTRFSLAELEDIVGKMSELSVTVVGDTILDDYQYCVPLGASSKEPVIAFRHQGNDLFAGGVLAIANHLSCLAKEVQLVSVLGSQDSQEEFIRNNLRENVIPYFEYMPYAPTLKKRRYLEGYSMTKCFEIYYMDDSGLDQNTDKKLRAHLMEQSLRTDLTLAADFGHGAISPQCRSILSNAPFLAVNTQANAGNRGFHTISHYSHCNFISLAEPELRLDRRDRHTGIVPLAQMVRKKTGASMIAVTCGKKGSYIQSDGGLSVLVPAFGHKVVDRVGAGDAFFSITALAARLGAHPEVVAFLGNIVGSIAVGIVGNKKPVDRQSIMKNIISLMK